MPLNNFAMVELENIFSTFCNKLLGRQTSQSRLDDTGMRENEKEREEGGVVSCGSRRKYRCEGLMSEEAGTERVSAVVLSFLKRCRHIRRLGCPLPLPFAFFLILPPSMSFPATSIASLCSEWSRLSCPVPRGYLFNIVTRQQRKGEKGKR